MLAEPPLSRPEWVAALQGVFAVLLASLALLPGRDAASVDVLVPSLEFPWRG